MKETTTPEPKHDGGDIGGRDRFKKLAIIAARLADAKKGEAVVIYDMAGRSGLTDFVLAVTVDNPAQLEAVEEDISINLKKEDIYALHRDGAQSKNWRVLDYGGLIVHVFEKKAREFFDFDKVYEGYSQVKWMEKAQVESRKAPAPVRKAKAAVQKKQVKIRKPAAASRGKAAGPKKRAIALRKKPAQRKSAAKKSPTAKKKNPAKKK